MTNSIQNTSQKRTISRVAIVGLGAVGSSTAYSLIQAQAAQEIVLVDDFSRRRAEGELWDLQHSLPFSGPANLTLESSDELTDCDMIIITAGAAQKDGETRLDLLQRNVEIYSNFFPKLSKNNPDALFCIVTNPVDIMTRVALKLSGLPEHQVFGTGTVLDTARFRQELATALKISVHNVHAYVVGEHGDSEVLVWSRAMFGPYTLSEIAEAKDLKITPEWKSQIDKDVRRAAYHIIERKGATHFAIGLGTARLVENISHNRHQLFTVSRELHIPGFPEGLCMSVPTEMTRRGAWRQIPLKMNEEETQQLEKSGEVLSQAWNHLGID